MDLTQFRENFPEFTDTVAYPDAQLTFWSTLAEAQVNKCAWGDLFAYGVQLYTAHEIVLATQNAKAGAVGGMPGTSGGTPITKTVGSVTVGFDATTTSEKDAGYWNLTNYGKQFIRLARLFGAGAIQL